MKRNNTLTQEQLKTFVHYNLVTGEFTWRFCLRNSIRVGQRAGTTKQKGNYVSIRINGCRYLAHRLAWLYMRGVWPKDVIDHINGDGGDNRWINLREATKAQNMYNSGPSKNNTSGFTGVYYTKERWEARLVLGCFNTKEEAAAAYQKAARLVRGEFAYRHIKD